MLKKTLAFTSTVFWVLLPKCSLCLYAYMGLFSALGLGNLIYNKYSLVFITLFLSINFITILIMLLKEKEYHYALTSFMAAIFFVCNKIYLDNNLFINILITSILVIAIVRVRLLNVFSKKCAFYGRVG